MHCGSIPSRISGPNPAANRLGDGLRTWQSEEIASADAEINSLSEWTGACCCSARSSRPGRVPGSGLRARRSRQARQAKEGKAEEEGRRVRAEAALLWPLERVAHRAAHRAGGLGALALASGAAVLGTTLRTRRHER